jgi:hypothetical protein
MGAFSKDFKIIHRKLDELVSFVSVRNVGIDFLCSAIA